MVQPAPDEILPSLSEWEKILEDIGEKVDYDHLFTNILNFVATQHIILTGKKLIEHDNISIYTLADIMLPFYVWCEDNPVYSRVEFGPLCAQTIRTWVPSLVNIFIALCTMTASGRIGVCIRHNSILEKMADIHTKKVVQYLSFLRAEKFLVWCFMDFKRLQKVLIAPEIERSHTLYQKEEIVRVIWLNRRRILL